MNVDTKPALGAILNDPAFQRRRAARIAQTQRSIGAWLAQPGAEELLGEIARDRFVPRLDKILMGVVQGHRPWRLVASDLRDLAAWVDPIPRRMLELTCGSDQEAAA